MEPPTPDGRPLRPSATSAAASPQPATPAGGDSTGQGRNSPAEAPQEGEAGQQQRQRAGAAKSWTMTVGSIVTSPVRHLLLPPVRLLARSLVGPLSWVAAC
ncbi:MAG: hypothetical protein WDW36_004293 [Sanguina aurantia]